MVIKTDKCDVLSLGIIFFISFLSLLGIWQPLQFIDGYYHLSVANGLIASNGWVGWAWWDFAPMGRPHLYPPLYHILLIIFIKLGLKGITAVKLTQVFINPIFFFSLWYIFRSLVNKRFALWLLLLLSGFYLFYTSVSSNIPASLALIFGFLSWLYLRREKVLTAGLLLVLSFYTHAGIPWIFFISLIILAVYIPYYRRHILKITLLILLLFGPFLYHLLSYYPYFNFTILDEANLTGFNIFILLTSIIALVLFRKRLEFSVVLFWGFCLGSILIFMKYPYRLFSTQGIIGLSFMSALLISEFLEKITGNKQKIVVASLFIYLVFFQSIFMINKGKIEVSFLSSTYTNLVTGRFFNHIYSKPLYYPKFFDPIVKIIEDNSQKNDVVTANMPIVSQIFAAVANRPSASSSLSEVKTDYAFSPYKYSKIIVWLKGIFKGKIYLKKGKKLYENDFAYVFLNKNYKPQPFFMIKARINFVIIFSLLFIGMLVILLDIFSRYNFKRGKL